MCSRVLSLSIVLALAASVLVSGELSGQEEPKLEAPKGWGGETIKLPPGFAPDMKMKGLEVIRFAPGMFKPQSPSFFSYVFVFRVDDPKKLDRKTVTREILTYYKGLARTVMRKPDLDTSKFKLTYEGKARQVMGVTQHVAVLDRLEPFATKKAQKLRLALDVWTSKKGTLYLFCQASPQRADHAIWKEMKKVRDKFVAAYPPPAPRPERDSKSAAHWPRFRGPGARGINDGQNLPDEWSLETGKNIRWKRKIPGLAHSSPVIYGDKLFVTTAISSRGGAKFKPGLYGSGDASEDRSKHRWMLFALDAKTGEILHETPATVGEPKERRHIKATYNNSTPATDGEVVVAFFGSQGLFAFDFDGKPRWEKDLGRLDVGAYDAPTYEWGTASSPVLFEDLVIVQCDTQKESFVLAADVRTGETRWRTPRDELPSWGTPTVCVGPRGPELVTNASNFIRGYDPKTGRELWKLGGSSKITAPTPFMSSDHVVVASGRHPEAPLFAIRLGGRGDLTLAKGQTSSEFVAFRKTRRGPYMPTPIVVGDLLFVLNNSGVFDAHDFPSGREVFRKRIPHRGSGFSASPVSSDGKIYLPSEDGEVFVVRASRDFEVLARNSLGELLMATPAIAHETLYVRTQHQIIAVGKVGA